jgi:hypothetical protein
MTVPRLCAVCRCAILCAPTLKRHRRTGAVIFLHPLCALSLLGERHGPVRADASVRGGTSA